MDPIDLLALPGRPFKALCRIPRRLDEITSVGAETPAREVGSSQGAVEKVWKAAQALYRTGLYPAVQLCIRREGAIVLHRAIGHAAGNAPGDPEDGPKRPVSTETPFLIYSASKAITAMLVHKLDERRVLHLDDRVCDYIPEFGRYDKEWITLRHVLAHRAGIPNLPPDALDLDLLAQPERVVEILCAQRVVWRPGRRLAYHAATGGFVLGEVVRRATGQDARTVLRKEILEPLGLRWMNYGVAPEDVPRVARDAATGLPVPPPFAQLLRRALGTSLRHVVELAGDPRFLTGVLPAANVVTTAEELSRFFQCLLQLGEYEGVQVFEPRTVRHAIAEQTYWELDLTLGVPLRYGLGFMLGGELMSLFGPDTPHAFGHLGFTNIFAWADPDRRLSVALLTSGKPFVTVEMFRLLSLILEINRIFYKLPPQTGRA